MYKILRRLILEQERINKRESLKTKLQDTFGFTPRIVQWITDLDEKRAVILARWILSKMDQRQEGSSKALKSTDPKIRAQAVSVAEEAVEQVNVSARPLFDLLRQIGESGQPFDIRPYKTVEDALTACMEEASSRNIEFNIDEDQTVAMKFPNGWYWLDLGKRSCEIEAEEMQHCATAQGDTLISLRDPLHKPHVTMDYQFGGGVLRQIKGKNNTKPIPEYHPYIVEFILANDENYPVDTLELHDSYGYGGSDFMLGDLNNEMFEKVVSERPDFLSFESLISAVKGGKMTVQQVVEMSPELFAADHYSNYYTQSLDGDHVKIVLKPRGIEYIMKDDDKKYASLMSGEFDMNNDYYHRMSFQVWLRNGDLSDNAQKAALGVAAKMGFAYDSFNDLTDDLFDSEDMEGLVRKLDSAISMAYSTATEWAVQLAMYEAVNNWFNRLFDTIVMQEDGNFIATLNVSKVFEEISKLDNANLPAENKFDVIEMYHNLNREDELDGLDIERVADNAYPSDEDVSEQFAESLLDDY